LLAATSKYSAVMRLLLERKANIRTKDNDERNSLHRAAERGREIVTRLLLERNAEVEAKDNND
jgi:ankyrin repeat protein